MRRSILKNPRYREKYIPTINDVFWRIREISDAYLMDYKNTDPDPFIVMIEEELDRYYTITEREVV